MQLAIAKKLAETASKSMAKSPKKGGKNQMNFELEAEKQKVQQLEKEKAELESKSVVSEETQTLISNLKHQVLAFAL